MITYRYTCYGRQESKRGQKKLKEFIANDGAVYSMLYGAKKAHLKKVCPNWYIMYKIEYQIFFFPSLLEEKGKEI